MSIALVILVTCCYFGVSVSEGFNGNWSMCVIFAGYAIANLGFIMGLS